MMDQETAEQLADLRHELGQLRSALGATDAAGAERSLRELKAGVEALTRWARSMDPALRIT